MPTILVVEDEADIRELIRLELSLDGFDVETAADGVEALRCAHAAPPDAIVLDLMLPGIDGWDVLRQLKDGHYKDGRLAAVPVIVLTARCAEIDRVRGGIEGALRYLTKPFDAAELTATLTEVLAGDDESVQRRAVQQQALHDLARIETSCPAEPGQARPRLSRLEGRPLARRLPRLPRVVTGADVAALSEKQRRLLAAVGEAPTVSDAAHGLAVSRSNVYSGLRRIARKLGVGSVPELIILARRGGLP